MNSLITYLQNNGTKVLGMLIGTLGIIVSTSDIIPPDHLKYWILAIAVLTYWRGTGNTQAIATAVVQQHADAIATSVATGAVPVLAPAGKLDSPIGRSAGFATVKLLMVVAALSAFVIVLAGCSTTAKLNTDPVAQAAVAALVDVAVGEAVQKGVQPAALAEIASELKAFASGQAVTVPALTAEIQSLVLKANLNAAQVAAVTILETTLDAVISQQLQAGSSSPNGPLSPDTLTTINIVLSDVVTAAQLYGAQPVTQVPATDLPQQNKHFVLSSVESPQVVGASASLVLIACLQAFAHVDVNAPVGAAITVLFTAGSAALSNLIS